MEYIKWLARAPFAALTGVPEGGAGLRGFHLSSLARLMLRTAAWLHRHPFPEPRRPDPELTLRVPDNARGNAPLLSFVALQSRQLVPEWMALHSQREDII